MLGGLDGILVQVPIVTLGGLDGLEELFNDAFSEACFFLIHLNGKRIVLNGKRLRQMKHRWFSLAALCNW